MKISMDSKKLNKDLNNLVKYSVGFLEGVDKGKQKFFGAVGIQTIEILKEYIDSNARVNPAALHHVYEWMKTGSPDARLFDISCTISNLGLSFKSNFTQSASVKDGSYTPFYNKASVMENGISVKITPKRAEVLSFTDSSGEQVFTKGPVEVSNPGGQEVVGSFERTFDSFFSQYFQQSFLRASGIMDYLEKPTLYKKNFSAGVAGGRQKGVSTGYRWIVNAGIGGL